MDAGPRARCFELKACSTNDKKIERRARGKATRRRGGLGWLLRPLAAAAWSSPGSRRPRRPRVDVRFSIDSTTAARVAVTGRVMNVFTDAYDGCDPTLVQLNTPVPRGALAARTSSLLRCIGGDRALERSVRRLPGELSSRRSAAHNDLIADCCGHFAPLPRLRARKNSHRYGCETAACLTPPQLRGTSSRASCDASKCPTPTPSG